MESEEGLLKRRRLQRACDFCRRKKSDGVQTPSEGNSKCSNCKLYNESACTYVEVSWTRRVVGGSCRRTLQERKSLGEQASEEHTGSTSQCHSVTMSSPSSNPWTPALSVATSATTDDDDFMALTDNFQMMNVANDSPSRFFGQSSSVRLVQAAIELKNGANFKRHIESDSNSWLPNQGDHMRQEFMEKLPWEASLALNHTFISHYVFPEDDLFRHLIDLFFKTQNMMHPTLHRPTFERNFACQLHLSDQMFGGIALFVCALAARFSDDPRVLLDGETSKRSSGWKYFMQVQSVKRSLMTPPTIHDLQFYALYSTFMFGTSAPQACWALVGTGIRLAQDVGAHRKKRSNGPTVEDELWKRTFWALVALDRDASLFLGRPCAIQDDDIDVEFPIECDDEYWEHPDPQKAFKQPSGKPSYTSFFISALKLNQIVATCLRTLYSPNKDKLRHADKNWEQNVVSGLDSSLNAWVDSIPEHLRWDPHRESEIFFNQSVVLYTNYYNIQILIHKPYIPSPRNTPHLTFPSLAICTNAARSSSHIIDTQRQRGFSWGGHLHWYLNAFTAALVLLLNIWGGKRTRMNLDPDKEMLDVHKCMQVLKDMEQIWRFAGRLWDILYQLASIGELPLPDPNPPPILKRCRDDEPLTSGTSNSADTDFQTFPTIIFSPETASQPYQSTSYTTMQTPDHLSAQFTGPPTTALNEEGVWDMSQDIFDFPLPVHSTDLGRMPPDAALGEAENVGWDMTQEPFSFEFTEATDPSVDEAMFGLWANAPGTLELDDWASYLAGVSHSEEEI
ncbi:hypothetical protein BDZ89DRAFT_1063488 [Hymenopellis radicata]|nr:hypothetical protein BDZ89DRAFT_1063488 [Hymenopellis radicata]